MRKIFQNKKHKNVFLLKNKKDKKMFLQLRYKSQFLYLHLLIYYQIWARCHSVDPET